jgi:hypothetical protein
MKTRKIRAHGDASRIPAAVVLLAAMAYGTSALGQTPKPVVNSPTPPPDVSVPANFGGNPIAFFDDYSWRIFIAMVWPGEKNQRGQPDKTKTLSDPGPRVFETYKALHEVFHNDGSKPAAGWGSSHFSRQQRPNPPPGG